MLEQHRQIRPMAQLLISYYLRWFVLPIGTDFLTLCYSITNGGINNAHEPLLGSQQGAACLHVNLKISQLTQTQIKSQHSAMTCGFVTQKDFGSINEQIDLLHSSIEDIFSAVTAITRIILFIQGEIHPCARPCTSSWTPLTVSP